jgi:hypothetical protein
MINRMGFLLLIFSAVYSFKAKAQPVPDGRRLRDIVEDRYADTSIIIGGTTGAWLLNSNTGEILERK